MAISERDAAALLAELIAIPSVNPDFRGDGEPDDWFGEARIGAYIADWLRGIGLDVEIDTVLPGRSNVIARLSGQARARRLLWEGHLDTVQASGMVIPPFEPTLRDGRLHGRGAVDDKGCLAAFMLALRSLVEDPPDCDVTFLAAIDEEYKFRGIQHHLKRGERYDFGVAGEPTELRIVRACKGCVRWTIEVMGKSAHSSRPHEGIDAIEIARELLDHIRESGIVGSESHSLLGKSTLTCTKFHAGEGPNTVPASARLTFDYRTLPGQSGAEVWSEIGRIAKHFAATLPPPARIIVEPPFIDTIGMEVPGNAGIVTAMQRVCEAAGMDSEPQGVAFGSDATKMTAAGTPSIIFGPGSIDQAHTADEFVSIAEVAKAAEMLAALARAL